MSPGVRRLRLRAVVGSCCIGFMVSTAILTSTVLGNESTISGLVAPESVLQWVERYGFPLVALVTIGYFISRAIVAVWEFMKPIINRVTNSFIEMIDKQARFIDIMEVKQDAMEDLLRQVTSGHQVTHQQINELLKQNKEIHRNVKDMHEKFGR